MSETYVRIEERIILPTAKQGIACIRICQDLSNFFRNIELFRFNPRTGRIYIFAGAELQIVIFQDGNWRFININDATRL